MRDKKTLLYLLIISTFVLAIMTIVVSANTMPDNAAKSFALYNPDTKSFVFGKDMNRRLPMASTTKIITALIAIEQLDRSQMITVPLEAVGIEGSSLYLSEGDEVSVEDLIYGVLLQSANDAATVLALQIGGTVEEFSKIMNERAINIGAENTNFENPHGLDSKNHYTTAHDLALIAAEAIKNDEFRERELAILAERTLIEAGRAKKKYIGAGTSLSKSIRYINENYTQEIKIPYLAQMETMCLTAYNKKFKQEIGMPPSKYIISLRMRMAIDLLETSSLSIKEISYMCGYNNFNFFARAFKTYVGHAPTEYRKLI